MTDIKQGLDIIENRLYTFQENKCKESALKQKEKEIQREKDNAEKSRLLKIEGDIFPIKDTVYNDIRTWRKEFIKTEQFKKIFNILKKQDNIILLRTEGYGHEIPYFEKPDLWSHLSLDKSGDLIYTAGIKNIHGPGSRQLYGPIHNFEKDYEKFSSIYFKKVSDFFHSEDVYKEISETLEINLKFYNH